MSETSNNDSEKLLSAASQLEGITSRMNGCVTRFSGAIETLDKGWVSDVKAGFMATYQHDMNALQEMLAQLNEITAGLRDAASDFDKTESDILGSFSALR